MRAASVFGRSIDHIRDRARKLGTPFPTVKETREKFAEHSVRDLVGDPSALKEKAR